MCLFLLNSCAKNNNQDQNGSKDEVIAYVNKEPIYARELQKAIEFRSRQEPIFQNTKEVQEEEIKLIIDRKLIIQEAVAQGLARNDNFVDTIKRFWEQTLVREFINFKAQEFEFQVKVTEDDIKQYYGRLGQRVTFKVYKSQGQEGMAAIVEKLKNHQPVAQPAGQDIGPVGYDEINSFILRQAFDLPQNQFKAIEDAPDYYVVMVADRNSVALQPLSAIRPEIEKRIISEKQQQMFEDWLKGKKSRADITFTK